MVQFFGFEIRRKRQIENENISFAPKETDDGAVVVAAGGVNGTYVDLDGTVRSEAELVTKYRDMTNNPEIDMAVDEIVNQSIVVEKNIDIVSIILDDITEINANVKKAITLEFTECLRLLDFNTHAYDIFRRWYVDGRLYYHAIIDEKNMQLGIKELRYIDPRKIRKIREILTKRLPGGDANVQKTMQEYYLYSERGFNNGVKAFNQPASQGLKIGVDAVVHCSSGLTDSNGTMVLSHLHQAIKPLNQVRSLEDATVIYRLSRAPERRIFYIDVGNLPKMKAEQYIRDMMVKYKNRLVYDSATGEIRDDRKFLTMLEDFWLPRREGGKGTEIDTLPAGQNLGEIADVEYFKKKLYESLKIPIARLDNNSNVFQSRSTEISRDELKFNQFITRLQQTFSQLFLAVLEKQLILKGIMTYDDWVYLKSRIQFYFNVDNYFLEVKENEILMGRLTTLQLITPYIGRFYSNKWVLKNVLQFDDDEIEIMQEEIMEEMNNPLFNMLQFAGDMSGPDDGPPPPQQQQSSPKKKVSNILDAEKIYDKFKGKSNRQPHEDREFRSASIKLGRAVQTKEQQKKKN